MTDTVFFYAQTDPYWELSNFAPFGVEMDGVWWRTVEHWFQAPKFGNPEYAEKIRHVSKPKDAKRLGMTRALPLLPDWEEVKDEIMYAAVLKKFQTHEAPRAVLLGTGTARIVEDSPVDPYWGCGPNGTGSTNWGAS